MWPKSPQHPAVSNRATLTNHKAVSEKETTLESMGMETLKTPEKNPSSTLERLHPQTNACTSLVCVRVVCTLKAFLNRESCF